MASRAFAVLVEALDAVAPKRRDLAVLYGQPPLNDAVVALVGGLTARGVRCHVVVDHARDAARCRAEAARLGAAGIATRHSPAAVLAFLRARYVFFTHGFYAVRSPRRQIAVNLWHGEFTKRIDTRPVARSLRGVRTTATSPRGAELRMQEFDVPRERVLVVGNPRADVLLHTTRAAARERLGLPPDDLVVLWLPTYRLMPDRTKHAAPSPTAADLDALAPWLERHRATLLVKAHPAAPPLPAERHPQVRVLVDDDPAHPPVSVAMLMAASDCLITDFSSAWSDYLLLDRPIVIHWPDHAIWTEAGDLPLTPAEEWFPGPLTTAIPALLSQLDLVAAGRDDWAGHRARLRAELHTYVDADNTSRLLDALGVPRLRGAA